MVFVDGSRSRYIAPSFMNTTDNVVPTYDYSTVQLQGFITVRRDEAFLRGVLSSLTAQEELKHVEPEARWEGDAKSVDPRLPHIVAFEIVCSSRHGKNKQSQNKSEAIRNSIAKHFEKRKSLFDVVHIAVPALVIGAILGWSLKYLNE